MSAIYIKPNVESNDDIQRMERWYDNTFRSAISDDYAMAFNEIDEVWTDDDSLIKSITPDVLNDPPKECELVEWKNYIKYLVKYIILQEYMHKNVVKSEL